MFGLSRVVKRIEQEKALDEISEPLSKWYSKLTAPDPVKYVLSGFWLGHELHALSATCAHAGGPLNKGHIEDDCIVCPWHQSKFRITDGTPMRGPAGSAQPTWDVRAQEGRVLVKAAD